MRKRLLSLVMIMVLMLTMGFSTSAANGRSPVLVKTEVYPCNSSTGRPDNNCITIKGNSQWANGTLTGSTATEYRNKDRDAFYVKVYIDRGSYTNYKLYVNGEYVKSGSLPSSSMFSTDIMVKNDNPGSWRLVCYSAADTTGIPLWGYLRAQ